MSVTLHFNTACTSYRNCTAVVVSVIFETHQFTANYVADLKLFFIQYLFPEHSENAI